MNYWLVKSEPDDFSLSDLKAKGLNGERWNGVRNYQARNFMRDGMKVGDLVFFYHSSCNEVGVVGIAEVSQEAIADEDQFDCNNKYYDAKASREAPRWWSPYIRFKGALKRRVSLAEIKANPLLKDVGLVKYSRLSVMPITADHWHEILTMSEH